MSGSHQGSIASFIMNMKSGKELSGKIDLYYWDEEQSAYIDSFVSGRRHVGHVLLNDAVPAITTPYFKFYELDILCRMGRLEEVLGQIKSYWGGMLQRGAVTFWEEYDPDVPGEKQYVIAESIVHLCRVHYNFFARRIQETEFAIV